jgi:ABC-2 type transport system permease protein
VRKLLLVVRKEYLERVRSRAFMLGTILGPLGMAALMIGPALLAEKSGVGERKVAVVDQSGADAVTMLRQELEHVRKHGRGADTTAAQEPSAAPGGTGGRTAATRNKVVLSLYGGPGTDLEAARAELNPQVKRGELDGYLVLPPDFVQTGKAMYYGENLSSVVWADRLEGALDKVLARERLKEAGLDESLLMRITRGAELKTLQVGEGGKAGGAMEGRLIAALVMIMMLYMMILMYGQTSMQAVVEEKTSRVVEVMLGSVTPAQLMMGKLVGNGLVGLTQFAIWGTCALGMAGQAGRFLPANIDLSFLTPSLWIFFTLFYVMGFVLYSSLYAAVGAMCNTIQESQQLVWPITIFVVIPIALLQVVMQDPDATHNVVLSLIPFFTPILMFIRIALGKPPLWQILASIVLLGVSVLLMVRAAAKIFRLGILSFGKAPTWPQIVKLLRTAD